MSQPAPIPVFSQPAPPPAPLTGRRAVTAAGITLGLAEIGARKREVDRAFLALRGTADGPAARVREALDTLAGEAEQLAALSRAIGKRLADLQRGRKS